MSRSAVEQRQLQNRGREFHFVSSDGQPANATRPQPATMCPDPSIRAEAEDGKTRPTVGSEA